MSCLRHGEKLTPLEYFNNNIDIIVKKCYQKYNKINSHYLRETLFDLTNECSSFRPTVIVSIIKMFKSKCLLDISSGWGDRLIGAMAADVDYYLGCDPNSDLHSGYKKMVDFFGKSYSKFKVLESPFETADIPNKPYDLIMTSPPYFDIEIYKKNDPKQSVHNKNLQSWLHKFMFVALKKAWSHLQPNGYLVLNINNKGNKDRMVEPIINFMNKILDADYYGCISYAEIKNNNFRNPQPMWIWRKLNFNSIKHFGNKFGNKYQKKNIVGGNLSYKKNIGKKVKTKKTKKIKKRNKELKKSKVKKDNLNKKINNNSNNKFNDIYNPKFIVKPVFIGDRKINVIRDDLLEAGSKQRAMIPFFKNHKSTEFVYVSPFTGSAQITLAYSALVTGKKVTVFMDKRRPRHPLTIKALSYGVLNLIEVPYGNFKKLNKMADNYVTKIKKEKGNDYITHFSLGFANKEYIKLLSTQFKNALPNELVKNSPARIWVPTGSTALLNALYDVFPNTHFLAVQTGKTVWDDQIDLNRTTLYRSEEFFYDYAKEQPPFPTTKTYDAKSWTFVKQFGKDGDLLLNITKDPNKKEIIMYKNKINENNKKKPYDMTNRQNTYLDESCKIKINDSGKIKVLDIKPKYEKFNNKNYKFEYCKINYLLKTNPKLEILRHKEWKNITEYCIKFLKINKLKLKSNKKDMNSIVTSNLAMWICINFVDKYNIVDPLIPYDAKYNETFIKTLSFLSDLNITEARQIFKKMDLIKKCNESVKKIAELQNKLSFNYKLININNHFIYTENEPTYYKFVLKYNKNLYNKLVKRYDITYKKNENRNKNHSKNHSKNQSKNQSKNHSKNHSKKNIILENKEYKRLRDEAIFNVLLRYKSLMGEAHQFAMGEDYKEILKKEYNINFECFASPINAYYDMYCSLFYDIDSKFGSFGNFNLIKYQKGFFISNPPYENELLEIMVNKFEDSINKSNEDLSISFGLPNWSKYEPFEPLEKVKNHKDITFFRCMKDGEVYWYDRLSDRKIKIPSHCRSVFQNNKGKKNHNIDKYNKLIDKYWVINKKSQL